MAFISRETCCCSRHGLCVWTFPLVRIWTFCLFVFKEQNNRQNSSICSDPSYESDPSNEYSPLGLTHVMNSIFLDPSNEFLTQAVNIGIPKQTLGLCFHVSKWGHKISYEYHGGGYTGDYWRLPMLMPFTEAWPRLAGVQKIVPGIYWLAKKLNIKFHLQRKQNEAEKLKDHVRSMVHGCASFRFLLQLQRRQLQDIKVKSWHKVFTKFFFSCDDEYSEEWSRTGMEFVMNN